MGGQHQDGLRSPLAFDTDDSLQPTAAVEFDIQQHQIQPRRGAAQGFINGRCLVDFRVGQRLADNHAQTYAKHRVVIYQQNMVDAHFFVNPLQNPAHWCCRPTLKNPSQFSSVLTNPQMDHWQVFVKQFEVIAT